MNYCPQFDSATPQGFEDQEYVFWFDGANTVALFRGMAIGDSRDGVPLALDAADPFYLRAIQIVLPSGGEYSVRFRDQAGNYLTDGYVPSLDFQPGPGLVLEPALLCVAGTTLLLDIRRLA